MKTFKLARHSQKLQGKHGNDIIINPKDFPNVAVGDVLEIYHPEEDDSRLLLQINFLPDDFQQKDTISIEQSIATAFKFQSFKDVIVNKVDPKSVALDLVELLFKDQYFSRSDMWRMGNSMKNSCVYLNKIITYSMMRVHVNELWAKGERVTCGVITGDTRIVYRSPTAVIQISIQMSSEMWDFDFNGDLYFEKAVNGFLTDLFAKWKEQNCLHDVTIVLFSRTFYDAQSRDEFPPHMLDCLQQDYLGRFYEDFYRVVVQNERYEDWTGTMKQLKKLFNEYLQHVLHHHENQGYTVPKARNSTAAQGNFLETLNMSLNLFEKPYIDRNFDRTGKVSIVITPGAGVFEVDRELTNITKQRTIDCGVGSDLVCMGEQPLHAAPLFKFHSKTAQSSLEVGDDYNIPHWMNHSFYTSKNQAQSYCNRTFVPRIKLPPQMLEKRNDVKKTKTETGLLAASSCESDDNFTFVDYDEFDAQVFKLPAKTIPSLGFVRSTSLYQHTQHGGKKHPRTLKEARLMHTPRSRHVSDDTCMFMLEKSERKSGLATSSAISIPSQSSSGDDLSSSLGCYPVLEKKNYKDLADSDSEDFLPKRPVVGSAGSPLGHHSKRHHMMLKKRRALINPFAPSRMQFKMTSNRRRWVHAFPRDPQGVAVQTHHFHNYSYQDSSAFNMSSSLREVAELEVKTPITVKKKLASSTKESALDFQVTEESGEITGTHHYSASPSVSSFQMSSPHSSGSHELSKYGSPGRTFIQQSVLQGQRSWLWGPTGEQMWSPDMTTGVDWKSLTIPASLPITTDYFPEKRSLQTDYVVSDYNLLPDDISSDYFMNPPVTEDEKVYRKVPLNTYDVFKELVSQRLAQGFQLILVPNTPAASSNTVCSISSANQLSSSPQLSGLLRGMPVAEQEEKYYLSIGRIFHQVSLVNRTITVTRFRPRHPNPQMCYSYRYRFQAPDSNSYDSSWSEFHNEKLESYNWNYLDQYICTRGEGEFGLLESLKFWRSRFFLLPCNNAGTKKIIEGKCPRGDVYEEMSKQELKQMTSGFIRYIEILNKLRKALPSRKQKLSGDSSSVQSGADGHAAKAPDLHVDSTGEEQLNQSSSLQKIAEAMLDSNFGLPMLAKQLGIPEHTFISADAVSWCLQNIKGVRTIRSAVSLLQSMLDECFICHASGNINHKMIYGFYLYHFIFKDKNKADGSTFGVNSLFQNEQCEVAILPVKEDWDEISSPTFSNTSSNSINTPPLTTPTAGFYLRSSSEQNDLPESTQADSFEDWRVQTGLPVGYQTWRQQSATLFHKYVNVDTDANGRSDRPEWATARYHAYYSPKCAFEVQVQWMVSTGPVLGDLITGWARKAGACGLHLVPVPCDPFALPTALDSDPLRGPIFVPLLNDVIVDEKGSPLFCEYDAEYRQKKMTHFQETIIKRFGFMPTCVRIPNKSQSSFTQYEDQQQYVHCSGGMFVLIEDSQIPIKPTASEYTTNSLNKKSSSELRKDYIARQSSQIIHQYSHEQEGKIGFLWSWNFMLSKRWRSGNTGDEFFQDNMLADFRAFCSNKDNRLTHFVQSYLKELDQ
ncbi:hypothetical protein CHS0354_010391 [Potamilus streckersoni]|uniref:DEP domain-containing protein n=1 Tax=Potamilus streckersoni TaxID=2493646 RepID=A0AAE0TDT2_9BIVA|nr:hypothetical protein CHS0354_010391 [Potamilus streckersoni]